MKMDNENGWVVGVVIGVGFFVGFSWCWNILKLSQCDFKSPYKEEVMRVAGIPIAPMGIIMGWVNFEESENE